MRPRFSVVIPVRDEAEIVGRCLAAVLAQTCADLEAIVVDAGSSDQTIGVVRSIADRRVRITDAVHDPLVTGLQLARGRFVTVLEAEDEPDPGWLARIGRLAAATGAGIVSCGGEHHHHDGTVTLVTPSAPPEGGSPVSFRPGAIMVRRDLLGDPVPAGVTLLGRWQHAVDLAVERGVTIVATPEPLVRWNERHSTDRLEGDELVLRSSQQAIDALARSPIPDPARLAHYATVAGIAAIRSGDHRRGRRLLRVARSAQPGVAKRWARWLVACCPPVARHVWALDTDPDDASRAEEPTGPTTGAGMAATGR